MAMAENYRHLVDRASKRAAKYRELYMDNFTSQPGDVRIFPPDEP